MAAETAIKLVIGIVFIILGLLLSFRNKSVSKGASKLYQAIYTEKNLRIILRVVGIILVLVGLVLIFIS